MASKATEGQQKTKEELAKEKEEALKEFNESKNKEKAAAELKASLTPMERQRSAPLWDHMLNPRENGSIDPLNLANRLKNDDITYKEAVKEAREYYEEESGAAGASKKKGGRRKTRKKKRRRKRGGNDKSITLSIKESQWNKMTLPEKIEYIKTTKDKNRDSSIVTDKQRETIVLYLTNPNLLEQMAMKEEIKPLFYFKEEPQLGAKEIAEINPLLVNKKGGKRRKKTRKKRRKKRRKTKKKKKRKTKKRYRNQRGCKR